MSAVPYFYVFWFLVAAALITLAAVSRTQAPPPVKTLARALTPTFSFNTNYFDGSNTWSFEMDETVAQLTYKWQHLTGPNLIVWDSLNGICGPNFANYTSMTAYGAAGSWTSLSTGTTLGTTPSFVDSIGGLVNFRLQLLAGDVRIESTNGDGRYYSIFGQPTNKALLDWPSRINNPEQIIWQDFTQDQVLATQFTANGNLYMGFPSFLNTNSLWNAASFSFINFQICP